MKQSTRISPVYSGSLRALAAVAGSLVFSSSLALTAVVGALIFSSPPALAATRAHGGEGAGSRYPAAAQYPRRPARPDEFARGASNTGGVPAGTTTPTTPGKTPTSSKTTVPSKTTAPSKAAAPSSKTTSKSTTKKPSKKKPKPGLHGNPARALLAYEAMQQNYYIPGTGLYEGEPYSYLWPFSQAFAATVSVSNIPGQAATAASTYSRELNTRMYGLQKYWGEAGQAVAGEQPEEEEVGDGSETSEAAGVAPPALPSFNGEVVPPGGASYYDDNEWVGIELARLYKQRHEAPLLEKAEQIMQFVMSGWSTSPKLACPGGVPFSDAPSNTDRNTVTDGPAAELGVQLYRLTGNAAYLQFAAMAYEWVRRCLMAPGELYYDHIRLHGVIDPTEWSYNQGAMIGAGVLLYQATGNSGYLYQARQTAKSALSYFTMARLLSENPFFVSVYFRNLMYLDSVTHDPPGATLAQTYVNSVWVHQRLTNGLFVFGSPPSSQLLTQAAIVQDYALLSTSPTTYF